VRYSAWKKAIEHAGITKESVDYINTHGTSTGMGDPIETNAIAELFFRACR